MNMIKDTVYFADGTSQTFDLRLDDGDCRHSLEEYGPRDESEIRYISRCVRCSQLFTAENVEAMR